MRLLPSLHETDMRCVSPGVTNHRKEVLSRLLYGKDKLSLAKRQTNKLPFLCGWTTGKWVLNYLPQPIAKESKEQPLAKQDVFTWRIQLL